MCDTWGEETEWDRPWSVSFDVTDGLGCGAGGRTGRTRRRNAAFPSGIGLGGCVAAHESAGRRTAGWPRRFGSRPGARRGSPRRGPSDRPGPPCRRGRRPVRFGPLRLVRPWWAQVPVCRSAALGGEAGEVGRGQVGADRLDPGVVEEQVDHVAVHPEPHQPTGAGWSEPELLAAQGRVPSCGHHLSSSTGRPARAGSAVVSPVRGQVQRRPSQAQRQRISTRDRCDQFWGWGARSSGVTGWWWSRPWCGGSVLSCFAQPIERHRSMEQSLAWGMESGPRRRLGRPAVLSGQTVGIRDRDQAGEGSGVAGNRMVGVAEPPQDGGRGGRRRDRFTWLAQGRGAAHRRTTPRAVTPRVGKVVAM